MSKVVELEQLRKEYAQVTALEGLSLEVAQGEVLGLLGHNGAGKTTTIKLILGMIAASSGEVRVLGKSPRGHSAKTLRMQWGYLPENVSFYDQLTGQEVLEYFGRLKRVPSSERYALLERVGLAEAAQRRVKTYSKGMRQRLGLAQALLGHPRLLMLDEPTVGLDPIATRDLYQTLDELRRQGTTVILSSHVLPGIERHIDRVAILREGKLRALGTLDDLRRSASLPFQIKARGHWETGTWEPLLQQRGITDFHVNGTRLEIASAIETKLEVMRMLLADQGVEDLDVQAPSLEALYVYYNREQESGNA
ncbi:MAG: ATP-binding cassette domain-containing protein [Gammaproteobacteria bacterium]|nr:ATP-binding cassette domain-containing protein [Gammaproteobacteria bacterium]